MCDVMLAERPPLKGTQGSGIVLASYGRGVLVQSGGETLHCALKGRKQRIVCGDRVAGRAPPDGGAVGRVDRAAPQPDRAHRRARPRRSRSPRTSTAWPSWWRPEPAPDWFLVDRYWAGAHLKDIAALLIVNKCDLGIDSIRNRNCESYRALGLPCAEVSLVDRRRHRRACARTLAGGVTLLVGPIGRRQVLDRQCASSRGGGANRRADARLPKGGTPPPRRAGTAWRRAPNRR